MTVPEVSFFFTTKKALNSSPFSFARVSGDKRKRDRPFFLPPYSLPSVKGLNPFLPLGFPPFFAVQDASLPFFPRFFFFSPCVNSTPSLFFFSSPSPAHTVPASAIARHTVARRLPPYVFPPPPAPAYAPPSVFLFSGPPFSFFPRRPSEKWPSPPPPIFPFFLPSSHMKSAYSHAARHLRFPSSLFLTLFSPLSFRNKENLLSSSLLSMPKKRLRPFPRFSFFPQCGVEHLGVCPLSSPLFREE